MARIALITGIAGQDGYYLSTFLRSKGYEVHGVDLPGTLLPIPNAILHTGDIGDRTAMEALIGELRPHEIYNLAGFSSVKDSFDDPVSFANSNAIGAIQLLEVVRRLRDRTGHESRFFQASSSEMFGTSGQAVHHEQSPVHPRSPYGCAKAFAHWQTVNHREAFGLFACCGILFNHESPRRPERFVTRKITSAAARIKLGLADHVKLGNIEARRDWGFAGDYVEAMWLMLQHHVPDDFVIATGETHSVREFGEVAFSHLGLDWNQYVETDPDLFRPAEIPSVCGDPSKARRELGWQPRVNFEKLAKMMVEHDWQCLSAESTRRDTKSSS